MLHILIFVRLDVCYEYSLMLVYIHDLFLKVLNGVSYTLHLMPSTINPLPVPRAARFQTHLKHTHSDYSSFLGDRAVIDNPSPKRSSIPA